jgi:hypothetical protein
MSALALGVRVEKASATQYKIPAVDDGNDAVAGQSSIIINGLRRYWTTDIITTLAGGAGTYGIYLTAGAGPAPTVTHTTGAAPANSRKIGSVVWDGSAITSVRSEIDVAGHGYHHRPGGVDALPTAAAVAITDATTNTEGAAESYARSNHTHDLDLSAGVTLGTGSANGLRLGGDVVLYRNAADQAQLDDELRVQRSSSALQAFASLVTGDAVNRFAQTAAGTMLWGDGALAVDTNLYRNGVGILRTDGTFRAAALQIGTTPLAASHLSNGTTGTGAVVLAAAPTLTGAVTVGTIVPGTRGTYTITNLTLDRTFDANNTTINELADIVGTIVNDLRAAGIALGTINGA